MTFFILLAMIFAAVCGAPLFVFFGSLGIFLFNQVDIDTSAVIIEMYRMSSAPTLVAIPLFTFAGYMMAESKTPERIVDFTRALVGWMPGGIAIVGLIACAFFTAFTGASGITIIALGGLLYPILIKERYPERFSMGLITTSGSLGLLFPPSLPLILYGLIARVNVDELFMAGWIPGILLIVAMSLYSMYSGKKAKVLKQPFSLTKLKNASLEAVWLLPLPVIIMGGIYGGIFTASEAAAVTVVYVLFVELVIYRDLKPFKDIPKIAADSMILVGGVLLILGCAMGLTNYLIDAEVPAKLIAIIREHISNKYTFLIVLNICLLVVGCLMDIFSAIIVVVPLILPIAMEYGVNPVHLGIIFLTNLEIGYSTPPVGLNLFISSYRLKKPIPELCCSAVPFLIIMLACLFIITYVPDLSLGLVELLKGK